MAMLADKKRKQKWLLNPNSKNHHWSKDSNKFGQKMLERMGWQEGKGLGRHENGLTENIKVPYKNNIKGIGFKDSVDWSAQQDNFKELLDDLSTSMEGAKTKPEHVKSLEEKSQMSRVRVHYKKFTRGKDLSKYSEKELANIFGKKKLSAEADDDATHEKAEGGKHGVLTIAGGSMVDYFKNKKLAVLKKANKVRSDSEDEHVSYGFGFDNKTEDVSIKSKFISYVEEATPKKRKSDMESDADTPMTKKSKLHEAEGTKKKKSKRKSEPEPDVGLTNPAFEPLGKKIIIQKQPLDTIVENDIDESIIVVSDSKNKKKKSKLVVENLEQNSYDEVQPKNKKKKSKKAALAIDNPSFDLNDLEPNEYEVKRKNKKSKALLNLSNLGSSLSSMQLHEEPNENIAVKQKKKKMCKGLDNPTLNISDSNVTCTVAPLENDDKVDCTIKQKKKKKSKGLDNPTLNISESSVTCTADPEENCAIKQKKKKKKSKGLDNPTLNISDCTADSEANCTIKQKKKKKSKGLDNPTLDASDYNDTCTAAPLKIDDLEHKTPDYEVKRKKKKKSKESNSPDDLSSNISESKIENSGIANSAMEISDLDIVLNVTDEPVKSTTSKVFKNGPKNRSKGVRFSRTNQEYIINENNSAGDVDKRNELFDINTKVIQDSLKNQRSSSPTGLVNQAFDIKSVDQIDFCNDGHQKRREFGVDNRGFDVRAQNVEESVTHLTKTIEGYQAEVENGINETKMGMVRHEQLVVGELDNSDGENMAHDEGVMLRFKHSNFSHRTPFWTKRNDMVSTLPKKSYKQLICGDIILKFKDSNLHKIDGYGRKKCGPLY